MGALGKPQLGCWPTLVLTFTVGLTVCAALLVAPAVATAQSSEIKKTLSPQQPSGQTEIRKSQPGAAPHRPGERAEPATQQRRLHRLIADSAAGLRIAELRPAARKKS